MTPERYVRDPKHGQLVPTGIALSRLVASLLPGVARDVSRQVRSGVVRPDLAHWVDIIAKAAAPVVAPYWTRGYRESAQDILAQVRRVRKTKSLFTKPSPSRPGFLVAGSPDVANYLRTASFAFAQSTLDTIAHDVGDAVEAVRVALRTSAMRGDGQAAINARLRAIFTDPARADRIGETEAAKAASAGAYQAAKDSGIVGSSVWMANANACDKCRALDSVEKTLGTPFAIDENSPQAYRVIMHPTRHPRCKCVLRMLVDLSTPIPGPTESKLVDMTKVGTPFKARPAKQRAGGFVRWQSPEVRQGTY